MRLSLLLLDIGGELSKQKRMLTNVPHLDGGKRPCYISLPERGRCQHPDLIQCRKGHPSPSSSHSPKELNLTLHVFRPRFVFLAFPFETALFK